MINIGSAILTITPQLQELIQCKSVIARGGKNGVMETREWSGTVGLVEFVVNVNNGRMFYVRPKWHLNSKSIVIGNLIVGTCWSHQNPSTEYVGYIDTLVPGPAKFVALAKEQGCDTAFKLTYYRDDSVYIRNINGSGFVFHSQSRTLKSAYEQ